MTTRASSVVLQGATVVTCDEQDRVLRGDVLVRDGRIAALGRLVAPSGARVVDARDRIVLPGLVMAHVHLCQALMRGMADDMPLLDWLRKRIWPLEAAHDERSLRASANLGLAEMLRAGTTAMLDLGTVHDHDVVFDACARAGVRVVGGKSLMDSGRGVPRRLKQSTRENLRDAERLAKTWHGYAEGRVRFAYIPRFILSCSERLVRGALERAENAGLSFHTHAAEHAGEREAVRAALGADDVVILRRWGMRGPHTSIAHGVQLSAAQIRALSRAQTRVVHCPSANLKLGSGIARVAAMQKAGVVVGLGADGAPCNNNLDHWMEIRHAALVSAGRFGPGVLPARAVLRAATIDGARVLGLDAEIGSVEVGKQADLVVVRQDDVHVAPAWDPVSTLVYATQSRDVEHVLIGGRFVVQSGELQTLDAPRVAAIARTQARQLARRAGI